ncbi:putative ribonuclease H-like domain-containing protein [Tanacetum coccineum]
MEQDSVQIGWLHQKCLSSNQEVIENGNAPPITKVVKGVETIIAPTTAKEKAQRRLELKARSTLLMGIPNEHQLMFDSIKYAKSLLQAVEKRFGGNATTKKTQWNLLKHHYENFTALSQMCYITPFDRLLKLISQFDIHCEKYLTRRCESEVLKKLQWLMLTMRARRFLKNTRRKITNNGNETIGFDKSKIEGGHSNLLDPEIYAGLTHIGYQTEGHLTFWKNRCSRNSVKGKQNPADQASISCSKPSVQLNEPDEEHSLHSLPPLWKRDCQEAHSVSLHLVYAENNILGVPELSISKRDTVTAIITLLGKCFTTEQQSSFVPPSKITNSGETQEQDIAIVTLAAAHILLQTKQHAERRIANTNIKFLQEVKTYTRASKGSCRKTERVYQWDLLLRIGSGYDWSDQAGRRSNQLCTNGILFNKFYSEIKDIIDSGVLKGTSSPKGGKITGRGTIKTGNLDFENAYFVRELQFNLFSVSQMCDKKNSVLFNDTECIVLSLNFKLTDESHVLLKVPRKNNMYSVDLKNIVPKGGLTCLFAKATSDESKLWHRRLGHINFKTMNKLVKRNLVRGLPLKLFKDNPMLHVKRESNIELLVSPKHRFSWVFFLATKDETSGILNSFITKVENLIDQRVKIIRCDSRTEFNNKEMNQFYESKGIKREFSVARTSQQNGVVERKNKTLIEAARTMLADSKIPTTFWAEVVNTACYVQNRVLVTKPHNKTTYELFLGRKPTLSFMRPFGCLVTTLNTIDHLGKFDGKADEGFFVGHSINSKAFRVFNSRTRIVEENMHVQFNENTPNIAGSGPNWLFDIDALTKSKNYKPIIAGNHSNGNTYIKASDNAGTKACDDVSKARMETVPDKDYILLPLWTADLLFSQNSKISPDDGFKPLGDAKNKITKEPGKEGSDPSKQGERDVRAGCCYFQVYVDDIIFGSTKKSLCTEFEKMMHKKFQMSSMGELTFFLGLQQAHLWKLKKLLLRMLDVCACARYQVNPKVSHLHVVKRIFRYLKGQPKLGLWYPKDSPFDLVAYTDSDYAGASLDRKSTTGGCQFLGCRLISWQCKKQIVVANSTIEVEYVAASSCCG